jgi:hypothetical protein
MRGKTAGEIPNYYELKDREPWFDEGPSQLLDQSQRAKFQFRGSEPNHRTQS